MGKSFNVKGKKRTTSLDSSGKETTFIWGKNESGKRKKNATREKWSARWNNVASTAKDILESLTKKSSDYFSTKEISASSKNKNHRQQRYRMATEEGKAMNLSDLKKELTDRGISTTSFFEKSDLIDSYANAVAENVKKVGKKVGNTERKNSSRSNNESFDPSYKDVIMHSFDPSSILPVDVVIDITETTIH